MLVIRSGQTTIQNAAKPGETTFLTPRPGQVHTLIRRETTTNGQTLERSSVDTDQAAKMAPGHIQHSRSTNKRTGGTLPPRPGKKEVKKST